MRTWLNFSAATIALGLASAACSTTAPTKVTDTWKDPSYSGGQAKNVFVIGAGMSPTDRRTLEDTMSGALSSRGVHATPSYMTFPTAIPTTDEARTKLQGEGYDAILVSKAMGIQERTTIDPGWGGGFYGYYGTGWGSPAYVETDEFVKFETTFWDPRSGKLTWSAVTQTENPSSGQDFAKSLTGKVIPAMTKAGLLPAQPGKPVSRAPDTGRGVTL